MQTNSDPHMVRVNIQLEADSWLATTLSRKADVVPSCCIVTRAPPKS